MRHSLRIAAILLIVALTLLAAEGLFRVLGFGGPLELGPEFDREEILYLPEVPGKEPRVWRTGPFFRLAVIGDSFTVGQGVNWDDTYPHRLVRYLNLNADPPPAKLRVFARNGATTMDEIRFLTPVLRWKPDLILLGMFLNDSEDHTDPEMKARREAMLARVPTGLVRTLARSSRVIEITWKAGEELRRRWQSPNYTQYVFDPEYSGWKNFEIALDIFARRTAEAGVPFVVVIFPHLGGLGPDYAHIGHERMGQALASRGICGDSVTPSTFPRNPNHRVGATVSLGGHALEPCAAHFFTFGRPQ